jgi:fumarate hydratase class II
MDRVERDSLGEVVIPADAKWGPQTQRAVENFPISGLRLPRSLIGALGAVKAEAARVNGELGAIPADLVEPIVTAAEEVAAGRWDDHFPLDVFQTGSGTSSNMNANEVIATLASERAGRPVHPNDHVNAGQSSNDVFPTAVHVAAAQQLTAVLVPGLDRLRDALADRASAFRTVVAPGRTHLMDATPVTLGLQFGGYAAQVASSVERLADALPRLCQVPLGGTAVGTGLNAAPGFAPAVIAALGERFGLPLTEAPDHLAAQGARDGLVEASGAVRATAMALYKVANDIRWLASGPRTGLAQIVLPELQPGSSIMPGKVNPVLCESVTQVAVHVFGNDAAVAFAGSQGAFELNTYIPVMAHNLLESIAVLGAVSTQFADRTVRGIEADVERNRDYAEATLALATALNPVIGYDRATELVHEAHERGEKLRDVVLRHGVLSAAEIDQVLDPLRLTGVEE